METICESLLNQLGIGLDTLCFGVMDANPLNPGDLNDEEFLGYGTIFLSFTDIITVAENFGFEKDEFEVMGFLLFDWKQMARRHKMKGLIIFNDKLEVIAKIEV